MCSTAANIVVSWRCPIDIYILFLTLKSFQAPGLPLEVHNDASGNSSECDD